MLENQNLLRRCEWVVPPNLGWLIYSLDDKEIDYLWKSIENKKDNVNDVLAGNISKSFALEDSNDWFFNHTLYPLIGVYVNQFANMGNNIPTLYNHPYVLSSWWVNYQKQHDFNPTHDHTGVYSFVIWLKIPVEFDDQNRDCDSNGPVRSGFQIHYENILGDHRTFTYDLGKKYEGKLLFFPSKLRHEVFPFYDCDEYRISVAGNILIDETKELVYNYNDAL